MVQFMPPVRRRLPRIKRHDQHARQPERELADAGKRKLDRAEQEAERHADADGDVAELGGALDRVAEVFAHGREVAAMGEHADAVAELQHEIRARQDVGVAAADLDHDRPPCRPAGRDRPASAPPRSGGTRRRAGSRGRGGPWTRRPGAASPRILPHLLEPRPWWCPTTSSTSFSATTMLGEAGSLRCASPQRHDLHARGQRGHQLAERPAEVTPGCAGRSRAVPGPRPRARRSSASAARRRCRAAGSARPRRTGRRPSSRPRGRRCRASRWPPAASACSCPSPRTGRAHARDSRPSAFTNRRLTAPASSTPSSAIPLACSPRLLVNPMKNCFPYWMPTP